MQTPTDNNTTFKLISYSSNGSTLKIYVNKTIQTITTNPGNNDGRWFADFAFTENSDGFNQKIVRRYRWGNRHSIGCLFK
ncbi:hypothetical protein D4L85_21235 [Chryseolinea soli]|uniref:Uncharacterized protein n=1 Tax=Chryseolinea soli TaxID=2321403 RepID=A0A385SQW3_9BACT|nr:hypothetical protein D4L85_21235 [Chryseolinea soli]